MAQILADKILKEIKLKYQHEPITTCTQNVVSIRVKENKYNQMLNHTKLILVETL